jgi:hypothetical protein
MTVLCINCKYFKNNSDEGSCYRNSKVDLVFGSSNGSHYSCYKERGYDAAYLFTSIGINHEICGVEGKFFEAKQ